MSETEELDPAPWSSEAEEAVIGGLLLDNAAWDRVGDMLQARHFYSAENAAIFLAIGTLVMSTKPADIITVFAALQERRHDAAAKDITMARLNALSESVPSARGVRGYAEIVYERWQQRVIRQSSDRAAQIAREPGPAKDKLARIVQGFSQLERQHVREVPRPIQEIMVERLDHITAMNEGSIAPGWTTGLNQLDQMLRGGFHPGRVYLLGGRPGKGKSALALWIAVQQAIGADLSTLYLSQEMPDSEVGERSIAIAGQISYTRVQTGKLLEAEWGELSRAVETLAQTPFHIDAQSGLSAHDIRIKARYVPGLKLLVLDYVQLCKGTGEGESSRNEEIGHISRELKGLAKDLGIAILVLSGLGRKVDERGHGRAIMSDFRDSGQLEADADAILTLFQLRAVDSTGMRIMGLDIIKNRQGSTGCLSLNFWGDLMSWGESEYSADDLLKPDKKTKDPI